MRVKSFVGLAGIAFATACSAHTAPTPPLVPSIQFHRSQTTAAGSYQPAPPLAFYGVGAGPNDYSGYDIVQGNDGMIYYSTHAKAACAPFAFCSPPAGDVGQFNPVDRSFVELSLGFGSPLGLLQSGDGAVWAAVNSSTQGNSPGSLARIAPFSQDTITQIPLPPDGNGQTPEPRAMTMGRDGNLWFTDQGASRIGYIPPAGPYATGSIVTFAVPNGGSGTRGVAAAPWGIAQGSDGNLWFTDRANGSILRSTTSGVMTAFVTPEQLALGPSASSMPTSIIVAGDNKTYFTEPAPTAAFQTLTHTGTFAKIAIPSNASPEFMRVGNGKVAFDDPANYAIGIYTVSTGAFVEIPIVSLVSLPRYAPAGVAIAVDGSIWFNCLGPAPSGQALTIGHLRFLPTWNVYPKNAFKVKSGTTQLIGIGESGDSGPFTATSSNPSAAAVANPGIANDDHNFTVTGVAAGTATIRITDAHMVSQTVTVTVL